MNVARRFVSVAARTPYDMPIGPRAKQSGPIVNGIVKVIAPGKVLPAQVLVVD